jgi:hypothetical protein
MLEAVLRVREKEVGGLISFREASDILLWPVAPDYEIKHGVIYPKGGWRAERYAPLREPDLFLSFARLGAHDNPSEGQILKWARKHGLLKRADPERALRALEEDVPVLAGREQVTVKAGESNQAPMSIEEFRAETRKAYSYLTLLESIRSRDANGLRFRIGFRRIPISGPGELTVETVALDGRPIPYCGGAPPELTDEFLLLKAVCCLVHDVEWKLKDIRLAFTHDFEHPRPLSTYRPRLTVVCPDLYSALYYQFARLIADERPWMNCEVCGSPILRTNSRRKTCGAACRKEKSRRGKAARE